MRVMARAAWLFLAVHCSLGALDLQGGHLIRTRFPGQLTLLRLRNRAVSAAERGWRLRLRGGFSEADICVDDVIKDIDENDDNCTRQTQVFHSPGLQALVETIEQIQRKAYNQTGPPVNMSLTPGRLADGSFGPRNAFLKDWPIDPETGYHKFGDWANEFDNSEFESIEELPPLWDITHVAAPQEGDNTSVHHLNERLIFACIDGQHRPLEALVRAGAEVNNARDTYFANSTALHCAATGGHAACVEKLLELGADMQVLNQYNQSAMHLAAYYGRVEALRLLYKGARRLKKRTRSNRNAPSSLVDAAEFSQLADAFGCTALDYAMEQNHTRAVNILRQALGLPPLGVKEVEKVILHDKEEYKAFQKKFDYLKDTFERIKAQDRADGVWGQGIDPNVTCDFNPDGHTDYGEIHPERASGYFEWDPEVDVRTEGHGEEGEGDYCFLDPKNPPPEVEKYMKEKQEWIHQAGLNCTPGELLRDGLQLMSELEDAKNMSNVFMSSYAKPWHNQFTNHYSMSLDLKDELELDPPRQTNPYITPNWAKKECRRIEEEAREDKLREEQEEEEEKERERKRERAGKSTLKGPWGMYMPKDLEQYFIEKKLENPPGVWWRPDEATRQEWEAEGTLQDWSSFYSDEEEREESMKLIRRADDKVTGIEGQ